MNFLRQLVIVVASVAVVTVTGSARAQAPSAGYPVEVEAKVQSVDVQQQTVELDDGTWLSAASPAQLADLRPGAKVKVLYTDDGGRKQIQSIVPAAD